MMKKRHLLAWIAVGIAWCANPCSAIADLTAPSVYQPAPSITYRGGPLQTDPVVYLVFWGSYWNTAAAQPEITAEQATFQQIGQSSYIGLLSEYGVRSESYAGTWIDPIDPTGTPGLSEFSDEVTRAQAALGPADPHQAQYLIFPAPGTNLSAFSSECAEHATQFGGSYALAVIMPFTDPAFSQCVYDYSANNGWRAPDIIAADTSIASHEFAEIATDTMGFGWESATGVEVADMCAWYSDTPADMTENVTYLWSVQRQVCAAPDVAIPSPPIAPPTVVVSPPPRHSIHRHRKRHRPKIGSKTFRLGLAVVGQPRR